MNGKVPYSSLTGEIIAEFITQILPSAISIKFFNVNAFLSQKVCFILFVHHERLTFKMLKVKFRVLRVVIGVHGVILSATNCLDGGQFPNI